jgi:outer membrane autotransporter protein
LFNALKEAKTKGQYDQKVAYVSGKSVLPNITQEELKVARSLDSKLMTELFESKGDDIRKMVGADNMYVGRDDMGTLTGYDIMSQSMYALYDQKLNNNYRLGLGLSFTHTDTDYNNDSTRKNFMVQGYVPLTYTNAKGLTAVSMARLGYADGDYRRYSDGRSFEGDTNGITYGLLNELRYTITANGIKLTPFIGLNAIGWYQDRIDEGDSELALDVASSHVFSLESALGLYLDKDIEFEHDNKLNVALGLGYYHEFADPYKGMDAHHKGSIGNYKLRHKKLNNRDRGILSAKVNYDYKDFSIYGELMQYLEDEYPVKVDVGLKYKF